ncbi:E3 ubiquitin-protein ligase pellino-like 3, partial [Ophiophagus hannah]
MAAEPWGHAIPLCNLLISQVNGESQVTLNDGVTNLTPAAIHLTTVARKAVKWGKAHLSSALTYCSNRNVGSYPQLNHESRAELPKLKEDLLGTHHSSSSLTLVFPPPPGCIVIRVLNHALQLEFCTAETSHSISYTLSRSHSVIVEYTQDGETDMFQVFIGSGRADVMDSPKGSCLSPYKRQIWGGWDGLTVSTLELACVVVHSQPAQMEAESDSGEEETPVRESGEASDEGPASNTEMRPGPSGSYVLTPEPPESGSSEAQEQGKARAAKTKGVTREKGLEVIGPSHKT